jgi:hypothetical protein
MNMMIRKLAAPEFAFSLTSEAAEQNYIILMKKYKVDLAAALMAQSDSTVNYGLEFRD